MKENLKELGIKCLLDESYADWIAQIAQENKKAVPHRTERHFSALTLTKRPGRKALTSTHLF
jgi:hypothetical protein